MCNRRQRRQRPGGDFLRLGRGHAEGQQDVTRDLLGVIRGRGALGDRDHRRRDRSHQNVAADLGGADREHPLIEPAPDRHQRIVPDRFAEGVARRARMDHRPAPGGVFPGGVQIVADRDGGLLGRALERREHQVDGAIELAGQLLEELVFQLPEILEVVVEGAARDAGAFADVLDPRGLAGLLAKAGEGGGQDRVARAGSAGGTDLGAAPAAGGPVAEGRKLAVVVFRHEPVLLPLHSSRRIARPAALRRRAGRAFRYAADCPRGPALRWRNGPGHTVRRGGEAVSGRGGAGLAPARPRSVNHLKSRPAKAVPAPLAGRRKMECVPKLFRLVEFVK
ncbi:hypothetical protein SDC9_31431 [bioreactor metagenome]|uniref:Uncharacterized protein n=1 Tax=bioreactor metagenome TaxID=1076179 RepID=A0A644V3N4_9ZZZZ